ncbi:MAG: T9SS type A sorting domain-containing protein [Bacteroidales bacterium]|nr:T9SS type A sorting domain-containing protein [Bacteroidales bacterium]MCF8456189.1 T9SS type A sorting domain-containing protein [Bacteroidales bacterium]
MKPFILLMLLIVTSVSSIAQILSQQVYSSGGDYFAQINGSLDFTMGESIIETYTNGNAFLTQGFRQGSEEGNIRVEKLPEKTLFKAYPNPFNDFLTIENPDLKPGEEMTVQVYDPTGKLLIKEDWQESISVRIDFQNFAAGFYLIRVFEVKKKNHQVFKVQKIK